MRLSLEDIAEMERLYHLASPQEQEVILELMREQMQDLGATQDVRFVDYVRATVDFELEPWQEHFCELLQDAADNPGTKLVVHKPPQMGGSIVASQRWPAWILGRNPMMRCVGISYSMQQAAEVFGFGIRNLMLGEEHHRMFPSASGDIDKRASMEGFRTQARTQINDTQFSFLAAGVQSGVVGKGFDCIPKGTQITTQRGCVAIENLLTSDKVLGYDVSNGSISWRRIRAFAEKRSKGMVEIATRSGRTLRCTPDHRVFVLGRGYRQAKDLAPGDRLVVTAEDSRYQGMPGLLRPDRRRVRVPPMHTESEGDAPDCTDLRVVQEAVLAGGVRAPQAPEEMQGELVQSGVQSRVSGSPQPKAVQSLRQADAGRPQAVLLSPMQGRREEGQDQAEPEILPRMRDNVQGQGLTHDALQQAMCGQGSFKTDAGHRELTLQDRHKLLKNIQGDAPNHHREGRVQMCGLRTGAGSPAAHEDGASLVAREPGGSPYRPEPNEQFPGEPCVPVPHLSPRPPQLETDTVAVVLDLRHRGVRVYDIEVEGTHNFFADGILIKNCAIADDLYGTPENALSPSVNEKVHRFFTQALGPRITERTTVVCMFHRYSLNDVAARLIDSGYQYVRYAMVGDENRDGCDPMGRKPGELLSPRRTIEWAQKIAETDIKLYMSQLQGLPLAAAAQIINPDSLRDWPDGKDRPKVRFWYRGYDLALVEHTPDESCSILMGMTEDGEVFVDDIQHWRKGVTQTEDIILSNAEKDPPGTFVCLYNEVTHLSTISRLKLHERIRLIEVRRANRDKYACAAGWVAQADRGKVFFSRRCKELPYFKVQCANFANEKLDRDDLIDAFSAAYESTHRHRPASQKEDSHINPDSFAYWSKLIGTGRQSARVEQRKSGARGFGWHR